MLCGDLGNDLVLAFLKFYLATDGSISSHVDWAHSAYVVPDLTALFSYDEMKTEAILTLQAPEVPCVQLKSKSAFRIIDDVQYVT